MRKISTAALIVLALCACDKHDPILSGTRTAVFASNAPVVLNQTIENLPAGAVSSHTASDCPYTRDASNTIWDGERKIFSGFPTNNTVATESVPVCSGGFVYAGLTTGELVKVNPKTRAIAWIADIYRPSNMTGGASVVDIVAPIVVDKKSVYVGGLGDAFCRINAASGDKKWCAEIGVGMPFVVTDVASFVVATDGFLYAVRNTDGAIYWRTELDKMAAPEYDNGVITVARQQIDAATGNIVK